MNNENDQEKNGQPDSEDKSPIEDIPLWLQGLEENGSDVEITDQMESVHEDNWIREGSQETKKTPLPSNHLNDHDEADFEIPDWLNELSNEVTEPTSGLDPVSEDISKESDHFSPFNGSSVGNQSKDTNKEQVSDDLYESAEKPADWGSTDDDFVEIPGGNFDDSPGPIDHYPDEEINRDEDLPYWLQEMINTPVETPQEESDAKDISLNISVDEPTEPIEIREVPLENEIDFEEHDANEIDEAEQLVDFMEPNEFEETESFEELEEISERGQEIQDPVSVHKKSVKDDDKPVSIEIESSDRKIDEPEKSKYEPLQVTKVSKTLIFAKKLLDQGDHNQAIDIINTYIERAVFLEEIQMWLIEIVKDDETSHDKVWEAIGDIALKQDRPEQAFEAYTSAIKSLLHQHEEHYEIG